MSKTDKLSYGVGLNDSGYRVTEIINGKQVICPFYKTWKGMLKRVYCKSKHSTHPTYEGSIVCDEWLTFSKFKTWMEDQDWEGKQLDKDLLCFNSEKIYSPETCVFITHSLNVFLCMEQNTKTSLLPGVSMSTSGKFKAQGKIGGRNVYLGSFHSEREAYNAYFEHKLSIIDDVIVGNENLKDEVVKYVLSKRRNNA